MSDSIDWRDYIVHLPLPEVFPDRVERARKLAHVRYLLVVGSLLRPRRIAADADFRSVGTYFNILDDASVGDREFMIEVVDLGVVDAAGDPVHVALVSHGIGASGAEIVLVEVPALIRAARAELGLESESPCHQIWGVGRSGTRATLGDHPYGTVGVSSASFDDALDAALPDPALLRHTVAAAEALAYPFALGAGVSTTYFWSGQGRVVPAQTPRARVLGPRRDVAAQARLWRWVEHGISFVEMEDHAVHSICRALGMPSVSVGAIIARRFDPDLGRFVLDYDAAAKKKSELWPATILLQAFRSHALDDAGATDPSATEGAQG